MFTVDKSYQIQQPLAQFFTAQLINLEWVQPGAGEHHTFPAKADIDDGAGHALVTTYAVQRPDGLWSLLVVNRDQQNAHKVKISFQNQADSAAPSISFTGLVDIASFGRNQYEWHPAQTEFLAHAEHAAEPSVVVNTKGFADPDGPILRTQQTAGRDTSYDLPAASVTVIRGKIDAR
jgi:hypothetical protein